MRFAKHIHVLNLLSQVPVRTAEYSWLEPDSWRQGPQRAVHYKDAMTPEEAIAVWDHIFQYVFTHWAEPQTAMGPDLKWTYITAGGHEEVLDCQAMLRMKADELTAKLESLPPYFTESVFPVAVGRYLIRELAIPFNHRKSQTFKEFHRMYGRMILSD